MKQAHPARLLPRIIRKKNTVDSIGSCVCLMKNTHIYITPWFDNKRENSKAPFIKTIHRKSNKRIPNPLRVLFMIINLIL